jgi:hypothetical protein
VGGYLTLRNLPPITKASTSVVVALSTAPARLAEALRKAGRLQPQLLAKGGRLRGKKTTRQAPCAPVRGPAGIPPARRNEPGESRSYSSTLMTTRRVWARPSRVELSAIGWDSPKLNTEIRCRGIP